MKSSRSALLVLVLLLPLLFIHINDAHDWGDDFSAFIAQAQAILSGKPYYETGFVPNLEKPDLVASPLGWSLLLLPVVQHWGTNMVALKVYVSVFFILWGITLFFVFQQKKGTLFPLLLIALLFYHPQFICFKSEILSDAAFSFFFTLSLYLISSLTALRRSQLILTGVFIGSSCLIRPLGFVLIGAVVFEYVRVGQWRKMRLQLILPLLAALCMYFAISKVFFPCENSYSHYSHFLGKEIWVNVAENASFYFQQWQEYWAMLTDHSTGKVVLIYMFSLLLIVGVLRYLLLWNVYTVTVLAYLVVVMVWPFRSQGFRYIYPILPFLVYASFESLNRMIQINRKATTIATNVLLFFLLFKCADFHFQPFQQAMASNGSQTVLANEMYSFLSKNIPNASRIVFPKPRVLCLYSHVHSLYPMANMDFQQMKAAYSRYQVAYFARAKNTSLECYNAVYSNYLDSMEKRKVLLWSNNDFEIFKRNAH